ncbi:MAG: lipid II flippase MurJ [Thermomicrobiales bacterium]
MRSVVAIALFSLLRGAIGFGVQIAIAARYGAHAESDIYFLVTGLILFLSELVIGVVTFALIPLLIRVRVDRGTDAGWALASSVLTLVGTAILLIALAIFGFAGPLVRLLAPGFTPSTATDATLLVRVGALGFACYTLALLLGALLQAHERYASTALVPTLPPLLTLLAVATLPNAGGEASLIVGFTAGTALGLLVQLAQLRRLPGVGLLRPRFAHPLLAQIVGLVAPMALAYSCSVLLTTLLRMRASHLGEGSIAALGFAQTIVAIPTALLITPLGTVLLTRFSLEMKPGQLGSIAGMVRETTVALVLVAGLASALFAGLAEPLVALLLQRGSFTPGDVASTASALRFLGLGLFAVTASSTLGRVLCVAGQIRRFAATWVAALTGFGLLLLLNGAFQRQTLPVLAGTFSLTYGLHSALLLLVLLRDLPNIRLGGATRFLARLLLAIVATAKLSELAFRATQQAALPGGNTIALLAGLAAGLLVGSAAFSCGLALMRGTEVAIVAAVARRLLGSRQRASIGSPA